MVQQANLNILFALLRKPIKFTANESPDYKADEPPAPFFFCLSLRCVYSCVDLCVHATKGNVKSWSGGNVTYFLVVRVPVSFLIHMGAALIKSSGSTIHTTGCLAKNLLVFCQVLWQKQQGELSMWVFVNVSERGGGVIGAVKGVCVSEWEGVSWPAEREILILELVDGPVKLAVDDMDIFVRGTHLSAGLIAEGMPCYTRPPDWANPAGVTDKTGRLLVSPEVVSSLCNFQALSNLNSLNVCFP